MLDLAAIGDCCVDIYPQLNRHFLGGTSYNFCLSAQKLGTKTSLISAIGADKFGKQYLSACRQRHINSRYLSVLPGKTSTVQIDLDKKMRPIFHDWRLEVLKSFKLNDKQLKFIAAQTAARCICLKPLIKIFNQFCQLSGTVFKIADFSGGTKYSPNLRTINQAFPFLDLLVTSQPFDNHQIINNLQKMAVRHQKIVLITLGSHGSQIFTKDKAYYQPSIKTKALDTTGAGDAYLATFIVHYLKTKNIQKAMESATKAAAQKITRLGASF